MNGKGPGAAVDPHRRIAPAAVCEAPCVDGVRHLARPGRDHIRV